MGQRCSDTRGITFEDVVVSAFPTVIICNTLVRYRNAVYDVTEFVGNHPGGMKRIMLAGHHSCDVLLLHSDESSPPLLRLYIVTL